LNGPKHTDIKSLKLYRNRVLIFLFFLIVVTYLDRVCISLVGVRIKAAFQLTNEQFGWVLAAFALAYALFEVPSGMMGDKIGQRASFIRIVIWWSLFTALTGATTGLLTLICARFLFGVGESGAFPNSNAVISRWFPKSETSKAVSILLIGTNAGSAMAPLIIVPIAAAYGWRVPFFCIAGIGLIWVLICFFWFKNEPSEMKGIDKAEQNHIEKTRGYTENKRRISWKYSLRNRSLRSLVVTYFTNQFAFYFFVAWLPVYLQEGRKFLENDMKVITSLIYVSGILGAFCSGLINDRLVRTRGVRFARQSIGFITIVIAALSIFIVSKTSSSQLTIIFLLAGNFFVVANTVTCFSICVDIGAERVGTVAGIMNFAGQSGAFAVALCVGKIVQVTHDFNKPLLLIAGTLCFGSLFWILIDPRKPFMAKNENIN
jgi:MFS transporter, ACS family, glucarate transporter